MLYILSNESANNDEDAILEGEYVDLETEDFPFNIGLSIAKPGFDIPVLLHVYINVMRGVMTDNLSVDSIEGLVLSIKAKELFVQKKMGETQFFLMEIIDNYSNLEEVQMAELRGDKLDYATKTYNNYFIANVIGLLDCVDHQASGLEYYTPRIEFPDDMPQEMKQVLLEQGEDNDIDFIRRLVLDESKIPEEVKVFRLKDCPRILVFKEEVVQAIREEKLTGFVFVPLDKYTDAIEDDDVKEEEDAPIEEVPTPAPTVTEKLPKRTITIKNHKKA